MNRRTALKSGGVALAALGVAMLPAMAKGKRTKPIKQAVFNPAQFKRDMIANIERLEAYDGAAPCIVSVERYMLAGLLRKHMGWAFDYLTLADGRTIPVSKTLSERNRDLIVSIEQEDRNRRKSYAENEQRWDAS